MWVSERGQTAPEYVGILAFVVAIVLIVVAAGPGIGGTVVDRILCIVTGGDCSDGPDVADPNDAFRPDDCDVYTRSTSDNGTVKVAVFTVGSDYGFTRTEKSTGETEITFVDLGELGLEAGVGAKFKVNDAGGDVSADIKAQLGLSNGDTWVFDSPEEADEFEGWLRREKNEDRIGSFSPVFGIANGIYEWASGEEDIPDARKSFWEVNESVEGSASGHIATVGPEFEGGAALAIGGMNDKGEDLDDPSDDTSTEYFSVNFDAAFDVGLLTVDAGAAQTGVQVFVADEEGDPAARATALAAELRTTFEEFEVVEQSETEVDGAESATLLEYTFTAPEGDVHSWDILAAGPDGEQVIFRVAGSEEDLDEDTAQEILDTLSFS